MTKLFEDIVKHGSSSETPTVFDRFFAQTLLRLFPRAVEPNHITIFRLISIPFVLFFLLSEFYLLGLIAFSISALSDALDGAMARTRNQVTDWGRIHDPLADKLLIIAVGIILITRHIGLEILLVIVAIEVVLVLFAIYRKKTTNEVITALLPGKIKMVLQSLAMILLLIFSTFPAGAVLAVAEFLLHLSIFFALASLFVYRSI